MDESEDPAPQYEPRTSTLHSPFVHAANILLDVCMCVLCTLVCRLYNLAGFFTALASLLSKHGIEDRDYTIDQLNTLRKQACLLFAKVCGATQPM